METVLLVIHTIIALGLIGLILIQRSDSDGFGLGSGSGANFMTGRAAANFLTRTTAILATLFILNSLALGIIASNKRSSSIVDVIQASDTAADNAENTPSEPNKTSKQEAVLDADASMNKKSEAKTRTKTKTKTLKDASKPAAKAPAVPTE